MTPAKDVIRYLKVKALAARGAPGERDNARLVLVAMEEKHPTIRFDSEIYRRRDAEINGPGPYDQPASGYRAAPGSPSGVWQTQEGTARQKETNPNNMGTNSNNTGNWENIFRFAKDAFSNAYGFAQAAANVVLGRQLAEEVVITAKENRNSSAILVTFRIPIDIYVAAFSLNLLQRQAFKDAMHEMLEAQLDILLEEDQGSDGG